MKIKKIAGIVGFVLLFVLVVYLKTARKMNRMHPETEQVDIEFQKQILESSYQQEQEAINAEREKERLKRMAKNDSIHKEIEAKAQKLKEIQKRIQKEIEEKNALKQKKTLNHEN